MKNLLYLLLPIVLLASCTINKNVMFKTDTDYVFDTFPDSVPADYRISVNDVLLFRLFTNEGARLLEVTTGDEMSNSSFLNFQDVSYIVESDGTAKLPEIGKVPIAGLTIAELRIELERLYTPLYNYPFAMVSVLNRRVTVFPGAGARAQVIPLVNQNTSVIEALALAGGIDSRGNASKVKLIRETATGRNVYLMDLSTIEGIQYAEMIVQANDIIYVEPVPDIANELWKDITPVVSLISGLALIYAILTPGL
jgi:polysaccharide biosynthesis/export protein